MIVIDNSLLDGLQAEARRSPRLRVSCDLRNAGGEQSQRMLNVLEPGTVVPIHRHRFSDETVVILRGQLDEIFYDDSGRETGRWRLDASAGTYGLQIPAGTFHSVEAVTSCVIIEMKAGAYAPATADDLLAPKQ